MWGGSEGANEEEGGGIGKREKVWSESGKG